MPLSRLAATRSAAVSLCLALAVLLAGPAWAADGADPARFRLSPALLDRMDAVAAELKRSGPAPQDEDDDSDAESVEDIARKLDTQPKVRAALARQKLSSREYATAVLAALHAGMYLAVEKGTGPKAMASFTPEQRANIEVMRMRRKP
ncbi:hypothetical protein GCM10027082_16790 [Comamonas humi]